MALFMRTRSDRFNILIWVLRSEHKTSRDSLRAAGMSGQSGADRRGGQEVTDAVIPHGSQTK